jgi:chemotaxis protein methyltransferase CheR
MDEGKFEAALTAVTKLTEGEPNFLDALLTLGNLCSLMGQREQSREAFAAALNCEPLCVEARIFSGVAALQAGALSEARAELSKALFLEPNLSLGHYLLAQVQERQGDRAGARRSYRNAIAQLRFTQRELAGHYPEIPNSAETIGRAAGYALAALEEG